MTPKEMQDIRYRFSEKYPNYRGLDLSTMKKILDGSEVIINIKGSKKFVVKPKEYIDNGNLARDNMEIRAIKKYNKMMKNKTINDIFGNEKITLETILDKLTRK